VVAVVSDSVVGSEVLEAVSVSVVGTVTKIVDAGAVVVSVTVFCSVFVAVTVVSDTVGLSDPESVVGVTVVVSVVVEPEVTVTVVPPSPVADRMTAHPWDTGTAVVSVSGDPTPDPPVGPEREVPPRERDGVLAFRMVGAGAHVPAVTPSPMR
jgi:hypothetical protein